MASKPRPPGANDNPAAFASNAGNDSVASSSALVRQSIDGIAAPTNALARLSLEANQYPLLADVAHRDVEAEVVRQANTYPIPSLEDEEQDEIDCSDNDMDEYRLVPSIEGRRAEAVTRELAVTNLNTDRMEGLESTTKRADKKKRKNPARTWSSRETAICDACAKMPGPNGQFYESKGHHIGECSRHVDADGFFAICPFCETSAHTVDDCPKRDVKPAQAFHALVTKRHGKPPIKCGWRFWELNPQRWDGRPERPQRPIYALRQLALRLGGPQELDVIDEDPYWKDPRTGDGRDAAGFFGRTTHGVLNPMPVKKTRDGDMGPPATAERPSTSYNFSTQSQSARRRSASPTNSFRPASNYRTRSPPRGGYRSGYRGGYRGRYRGGYHGDNTPIRNSEERRDYREQSLRAIERLTSQISREIFRTIPMDTQVGRSIGYGDFYSREESRGRDPTPWYNDLDDPNAGRGGNRGGRGRGRGQSRSRGPGRGRGGDRGRSGGSGQEGPPY